MNVNKMRILLLWCLAFFVLACNKDKVEGFSDGSGDETSTLSFVLKTDYSLNEVALTRAGGVPPDADFKVRIENTRAEVLRTWDYENVPSLIKVVPGSYKLVAWYGNDSILPAFESPYYYGELKVTLKEGDNLDTIVKSTNAAVKVAVKFDESFGYEYDDYWVDIKTVGDSLSFAKNEKREAFFKPGKLRMRFVLKPKGKNEYLQFYPDPIANVKAKEFYNMTLKAQTKNGALSGISITTDSSTIDIPVNVELPPFYLPKAAPKVTLQGFASGDVIETTEGISKPATVMIASSAGLTELKIKTVSDTLIARGWPEEIDLMKATPEQRELLKKSGLDWSKDIDTKDTIKTTVWVKFDNVVKLLNTAPGQTATSAFEVDVKDRFHQVGSSECKFNVNVAPPVFEFVNAPGEGNVFAKRTVYDIKYASEVRTPIVECKGVDGNWIPLETVLNNTTAEVYECIGKGLVPATSYAFRVRMGEHILNAGNYTTEDVLQVPNSDFETYCSIPNPSKNSYEQYYWFANNEADKWWATRNAATAGQSTGVYNGYCCLNSTYPVDRDGKKAVCMETVGWGAGTTLLGNQSSIYNVTSGILYIGNYTHTLKNGGSIVKNQTLSSETIDQGHSFVARPLKFQFDYMYTSYNNDSFEAYAEILNGNIVIARAEVSGINAVTTSAWNTVSFDFVYNENYKRLKAETIRVFFSSSKIMWPDFPPYEKVRSGHHYGSKFYIDNLNFEY